MAKKRAGSTVHAVAGHEINRHNRAKGTGIGPLLLDEFDTPLP